MEQITYTAMVPVATKLPIYLIPVIIAINTEETSVEII